jgi:outer membrane protein assembly factor BamB
MGDGFVALLADSRLEMCSAKDGKTLWSLALAGNPGLPPVALGDKIAAATSQGDDHYLYLVSDKGAVVWRALLYAKAACVVGDSKRLYVSTEDGEVTAYDLQ